MNCLYFPLLRDRGVAVFYACREKIQEMSHTTAYRSSLVICFLVFGTFCYGDIIVDSYTHATNDRFSNDPSFVAAGFNLSGVGQDVLGRWATAISSNVVISANHFPPSGNVFFYPGNDANTAPVVRQIVSGQQVGQTDLWLGVLDQALPNSIVHYPITSELLTGTPDNVIVGDAGSFKALMGQGINAYLFGRSPFDESLTGDNRFSHNDQAVGRNRVSGYVENAEFLNANDDALVFFLDPTNGPDFVTNEALFQGGDSGGPTFADISGQLVLLGTNAFLLDNNAGSGINYVGNQASVIQNFIQLNAVPEPGVLALLVATGATVVARSRQRMQLNHSVARL